MRCSSESGLTGHSQKLLPEAGLWIAEECPRAVSFGNMVVRNTGFAT